MTIFGQTVVPADKLSSGVDAFQASLSGNAESLVLGRAVRKDDGIVVAQNGLQRNAAAVKMPTGVSNGDISNKSEVRGACQLLKCVLTVLQTE